MADTRTLPPLNGTMCLAVFASGGGSNLEAIFEAIERGHLPASVALVVSDRAEAGALDRARARDVPVATLSPAAFSDSTAYSEALLDALAEREVNFIALAGYLKKIPDALVQAARHRMLNIHPSLIPAFCGPGMYGRRVHQAVLDYGVRWTGATVHLVDEHYDSGPIVLQEPVHVRVDDTVDRLAARVLKVEHRLYPLALRFFAQGRVRVEGRRVYIHDLDPSGP